MKKLIYLFAVLVTIPFATKAVEVTNVQITTTHSLTVTNVITANLTIHQLTYNFDKDTILVTLAYDVDGEVIAKGKATLKPLDENNYTLEYNIFTTKKKDSIIVPKTALTAVGFDDGVAILQNLTKALGTLIVTGL